MIALVDCFIFNYEPVKKLACDSSDHRDKQISLTNGLMSCYSGIVLKKIYQHCYYY